jgi:hypothetical protein
VPQAEETKQGDDEKPGGSGNEEQRPLTDRELRRMVDEKFGGQNFYAIRQLNRRLVELENKNAKLRRRNRELEDGGPKLAEGAVILAGEDATAFADLKQKGVALKQIPTILTEHGTLKQAHERFEREKHLARVATELGYSPQYLKRLAESEGLVFEQKAVTVERDGKELKEQRWHARRKDAQASDALEADTFLEREYPEDFHALRSLPSDTAASNGTANGAGATGDSVRNHQGIQAPAPIPFPRQSAGGGRAGQKDAVGEFIKTRDEQRAKQASPLQGVIPGVIRRDTKTA